MNTGRRRASLGTIKILKAIAIPVALLLSLLLLHLSPLSFASPTAAAEAIPFQEPAEGRWIYLRQGLPIAAAEDLVEVIAVGDLMPGRGLANTMGLFDHVAPLLQGADLVVGNLEGVLSSYPSPGLTHTLILPPAAAESLAAAGFDLLGLANNHALDLGPAGLAQTRAALQAAGIQPLLPAQAVYRQVGDLTFAFLAWSEIPPTSRDPLFAAIKTARSRADILILLLHWGREYQRSPAPSQRDLADELLSAGVDILLGAHPHVAQDLQLSPAPLNPRLVAYSLGNFAFDQGWDDTAQGLALRLLFDRDGLRSAQALPVRTTPRPAWLDPTEAAGLLSRILPAHRLGFDCSSGLCMAVEVPQQPGRGQFWSGAIDLTGDGRLEIVRRVGGKVQIFQNAALAWQSPPEWQVNDLALGDPNHDGRYEVLLALQKPGPGGELTSHPFILGYRGGEYRTLWGGSAVESPLLEVELADLDEDGLDELAVIEASSGGGSRCLTVWRWHGWGFSLLWRSEAGDYHDLAVIPGADGLAAQLAVADGPPP